MLSREFVAMYLTAIKSLLRFQPEVSVVVHSDGTLDGPSRTILSQHVPGVRIIHAEEADAFAEQALGKESLLFTWRNVYSSFRRLIDAVLWCRAERRVMMDSDVLFLREPIEILEWISGGGRPFIIGQPPQESKSFVPDAVVQSNVQTIFRQKLGELSTALSLPNDLLPGACAGLHGCGGELSLGLVEKIIRESCKLNIPLANWGGEQCVTVYGLSVNGAERLPPRRYFNFYPDCLERLKEAAGVHFVGIARFHRWAYPRVARRMIRELRRG